MGPLKGALSAGNCVTESGVSDLQVLQACVDQHVHLLETGFKPLAFHHLNKILINVQSDNRGKQNDMLDVSYCLGGPWVANWVHTKLDGAGALSYRSSD